MTLVLMVGAGLMIRSLLSFQSRDIGIGAENLLTARLTLPAPKYSDAAARIRFEEDLLEQLRATPGLEPVTLASHAPMTGGFSRTVRIGDVELKSVQTVVVVPGILTRLVSESLGAVTFLRETAVRGMRQRSSMSGSLLGNGRVRM